VHAASVSASFGSVAVVSPHTPSRGQPSDGRAERGKCTVASPGSGQAQATPPRRLMIGRLNNRACATGKTSKELTASKIIGCYGNPTSARWVTMRLKPPHRQGNMGKSQRQDPALGSFPWLLIVVVLRAEFLECSAALVVRFSALLWGHKVR